MNSGQTKSECSLEAQQYQNSKAFHKLRDYILPKAHLNETPGHRDYHLRTEALVIRHRNCTWFENYRDGYSPEKKHLAWSISKSVTSLAIGRAERLGLLNRKDLVKKYFPQMSGIYSNELSIENLLDWSSGFQWNEGYEFNPLNSNVVAMLYTGGRQNMAQYVLNRPWAYRPGTKWQYSTGDSTLLMAVLQKALKQQALDQFLQKQVFGPIGLKKFTWEEDASGTAVGGAYFYTTARGLARIGELLLNNGRWKSKQLLPKDWLKYAQSIPQSYSAENHHDKDANSGVHWWVNHGDPDRAIAQAWSDVPKDLIFALGHWGQVLVIVPSENLVVARFGNDWDGVLDQEKFFHLLYNSVKSFHESISSRSN